MKLDKLFNEMHRIAQKRLKSYQADLDQDKATILKNPQPFLWFVRPHGTFLIPLQFPAKEEMDHAISFFQSVRRVFAIEQDKIPSGHALFIGSPITGELRKCKSFRGISFEYKSDSRL